MYPIPMATANEIGIAIQSVEPGPAELAGLLRRAGSTRMPIAPVMAPDGQVELAADHQHRHGDAP